MSALGLFLNTDTHIYKQCDVRISYDLGVQSNERIYPSNTAVVAGKQFSLVCENHSDGITPMISWRFLRVGTSTESLIYNGTHLSHQFGDFQVHSTADGISNLTKHISNIDDAGIYRCIQKYGSNYVRSSAQVIVLGRFNLAFIQIHYFLHVCAL